MLLGPGRCPAVTSSFAAAALCLAGAAAAAPVASAAVSGAATTGVSTPASTAPAPTAPTATAPAARPVVKAAPALRPVSGVAALDAGVATRRAGRRAVSAATIAYVSHAPAPTAVRIDVVRRADGLSVFQDTRTAAPEQPRTVAWDGRTAGGRALDGPYEVRISAGPQIAAQPLSMIDVGAAAGGAAPEGAPAPVGSARIGAFTFLSAVFPVLGRHDFGGSGAQFGAGRTGHMHEGQDVLAACGLPVVAARGGIVKNKATQSAAGNYVVISDPLTGEDQMYAHFRAPALVARGARVETGQQIGIVGDTGSASACHLHFEIWSAPGWYEGGSAIDPLPTLRRWEALSR